MDDASINREIIKNPDYFEGLAWQMKDPSLRDMALRDIAKLIVTFDPDRAERLVKSQGERALHDASLVTLVKLLAPTNPLRAERMARSIIDPEDREIAMFYVRR